MELELELKLRFEAVVDVGVGVEFETWPLFQLIYLLLSKKSFSSPGAGRRRCGTENEDPPTGVVGKNQRLPCHFERQTQPTQRERKMTNHTATQPTRRESQPTLLWARMGLIWSTESVILYANSGLRHAVG